MIFPLIQSCFHLDTSVSSFDYVHSPSFHVRLKTCRGFRGCSPKCSLIFQAWKIRERGKWVPICSAGPEGIPTFFIFSYMPIHKAFIFFAAHVHNLFMRKIRSCARSRTGGKQKAGVLSAHSRLCVPVIPRPAPS